MYGGLDFSWLPVALGFAGVGVLLSLYEIGRLVWFIAHHIQIIW